MTVQNPGSTLDTVLYRVALRTLNVRGDKLPSPSSGRPAPRTTAMMDKHAATHSSFPRGRKASNESYDHAMGIRTLLSVRHSRDSTLLA